MTEVKSKTAGPRPANGGTPTPGRIVLVAGGEESGSVDTAVPAIVVRAYRDEERDLDIADVVAFNTAGSAATAYPGVPVLGNDGEAREWLEGAESDAARRTASDTSPARRGVVAFWPTRG